MTASNFEQHSLTQSVLHLSKKRTRLRERKVKDRPLSIIKKISLRKKVIIEGEVYFLLKNRKMKYKKGE